MKDSKEIAALLTGMAHTLEAEVGDFPTLRGLISQINRKAVSVVRVKQTDPVRLQYQDEQIVIENIPYLYRAAFTAWRLKLSEITGQTVGTRVATDGTEVPVFASTYDKELGKNVLPMSSKEKLLEAIHSFFPDSPIQEV